jgi:hypothetical protein
MRRGVSGAHLNPAVSLAFAAYRDFPWRKVVPYAVAQLLGAFWRPPSSTTYREALDAFDNGCGRSAVRPRRPGSGRPTPTLPVDRRRLRRSSGRHRAAPDGHFALVDAKK